MFANLHKIKVLCSYIRNSVSLLVWRGELRESVHNTHNRELLVGDETSFKTYIDKESQDNCYH